MSEKIVKDTVIIKIDVTVSDLDFVLIGSGRGVEGRHRVTVEVPLTHVRSVADKLADAATETAMQVFKFRKLQRESEEGAE